MLNGNRKVLREFAASIESEMKEAKAKTERKRKQDADDAQHLMLTQAKFRVAQLILQHQHGAAPSQQPDATGFTGMTS